MTDSENPNPYAPPQVASESVLLPKPSPDRRRIRRWAIVECLVIAGALAAQAIDIESIIISGPVFGLVGLGVAIMGRRSRHVPALMFGGSAFAFAIFIFVLINLADWGPREATRPVMILSWIYTVAVTPVAWRCLRVHSTRWITEEMDSTEESEEASPVAESSRE